MKPEIDTNLSKYIFIKTDEDTNNDREYDTVSACDGSIIFNNFNIFFNL